MYQGKHDKQVGRKTKAVQSKRRLILTAASILLLLTCIIGSTVAYLTEKTPEVENTFTAAVPADPEIQETFDGGTKSDVFVKLNGGDGSYFVRAAVVISLQDDSGNTVAQVPVSGTDYTISMGSDWTQNGNYWYYNSPVAAGEATTNLINSCTTLNEEYKLVVEILAQTIQSVPTTAAETEWGYVPGTSN